MNTKKKLIRVAVALLFLGVVRGMNPSTEQLIRAPGRGVLSSIAQPTRILVNTKKEYLDALTTRTDMCIKWKLTGVEKVGNSSKPASQCGFAGNALLLLLDLLFVASVYNLYRQVRKE